MTLRLKIQDEDEAWEASSRLEKILVQDSPDLKVVRRYANAIAKWCSEEIERRAMGTKP